MEDYAGDSARAILAVPKKGRLHEKCMKLLEGIGLEHTRVSLVPKLNVHATTTSATPRATGIIAREDGEWRMTECAI